MSERGKHPKSSSRACKGQSWDVFPGIIEWDIEFSAVGEVGML